MRLNSSDIAAMLLAGVMIYIATECVIWAITGNYIGR